jgi:hypothetical protein
VTNVDRALFDKLGKLIEPGRETEEISTAALVGIWLARGPERFTGEDRVSLEALCRQVDVRKKVSAAYAAGWKASRPEIPADPPVVAGVVAVMIANAVGVDAPPDDGSWNDGWALKCLNSALKALDLRPDIPCATELRSAAVDVLGRLRPLEVDAR